MTSLREELGARPNTATPYTILCPPGWRRVDPLAVADGGAPDAALAAMKSAGRADLVMQFRGMLTRYRAAVRDSNAFDAYIAPLVDDIPLPASMIVAPFVLPPEVTWDRALARLSRGAEVTQPEYTETTMWQWTRSEVVADDAASLEATVAHFLVPVPEDDPRRALHFQYTVMSTDDPQVAAALEPLRELGALMMATMRWVRAPRNAGTTSA